MSAFLCSNLHTAAVALFATSKGIGKNARHTATALRRLNNRALAARYGEKATPLSHSEYCKVPALELSPADMLQLAACLQYQCSEGDCDTQPEWALLENIRAAADDAARGLPRSPVWSI